VLICRRVDLQASPEVVQRVISSQLQRILGSRPLPEYQAQYLQQHSSASLLHLAAAAEAAALLEPSQKEASAQLILSGSCPHECHEISHAVRAQVCCKWST